MRTAAVKTIACVGAGLIGHSWALLFATNGFSVILCDLNDEILTQGIENMKSDLRLLTKKGLLQSDVGHATMSKVKTTTDLTDAVASVDYVQESATERYEVKKALFKKMDASAPEHAILASSASGLLMTEIQRATKRPERCVLVHPWHPAFLMPLVEIAGGEKTSEDTIRIAYELMLRLRKTPVVLRKEVSGYIGNRIQAAVLREAIDLVDKGVATVEDVDKAVSSGPGLRWALTGPFLSHHIGGKGIEGFFEHFGPSYEPRWKSMATWTSIPASGKEKVIKGVYQLEMVRSRSMAEISEWRDDKLLELLKILRLPRNSERSKA